MVTVKMAWKKLVLKNHVIHRRHNGDTIECRGQGCDVHLKAGDTCYSHYNNKHGSDYYCPSCYEKLWI